MATRKPTDTGKTQPGQNSGNRTPQPTYDSINEQKSPATNSSDTTVSRMQPARRDGSSGGNNDKGK